MANTKKKTEGLNTSEELLLITDLNDFSDWLIKKGIIENMNHISHRVQLPFANEDWVMRVDQKERTVSFNTYIREKCSFDYYRVVILHEFFHLAVQKVPNKEDATRVKDDFGEQLMKLIDIEADYFTALFFKEEKKFDLVRYLCLYYEGSRVFADPRIRINKLERFIGSILSTVKLFIFIPSGPNKTETYDLYLPSISPIYTESSLHVLVVRKEHIYFDEILATYEDFVKIKECYTNIDTYTQKAYVERLVNFASKALRLEVPKEIKTKINNLN